MKSFVSKLTNVLGNTAKVADLGEENQFYFSQEWNCWVEKGKEAETLQNLEKRVCPPPSDKQIQDRHQLPPLLPKARPTGIEALMQPPNYRLPHHHKKPPTTENFGAATDFDDNANQWDGVASMEKISECTQPVPSGNFNAPVSLDDDDDDEEEQSRYWPTNENFMSSHNQEEQQQQQRWGDDEAVNSNDGETASKWEANRYVVQQQRNSSYHTQYPPSYDNPPLPPSYKTGSDLPYDGRPSAYHPPLAYGDPPACGEPPSYGEPPSSGEPPYDRGGPYGELSAFDVRADPPSHNGGGAPPYGELSAFDDRADPPLYNGGPPPYGELSSFDDRADPPLFNGGPPPYGELSAFDDRADPPLFNGGPPAYGEPPAADDGSDPPPYNRGPPAFDGRPESPPYNDGPPPYGELTAFNDLQEPPPPPYNGDPLAYGEEPPAFDDGLVPYDGGSYGDPSVYDDSKFPPSYGQYPLAKTIEVPPELPVSSTDERGSTITFEPENNSKTQFAPNSFEPSGWVEAAVSNAQASNTSAKWQSTFLTAENVSSEVDRNYGEMQFPKHHDSSTTTKYEVVANLKGKYYQATGATLPWREEVENEVLSPKPKGLFSQSPDNTKFSETVSSCRNKCPPTVLERKQLDSCEESSPTPKLSQRWNSDGIFHTRPVMTTSVTHLRPKAEETIISGIQKKTRKGSERGTTHIDNPHFVVASDISSCSEDSLSLKEGEEPPFAAPPNDSSSDRETLSYIHSQLDSLKNWSKTRQLKNDDWQVKLESLLQKFSTSMENALTRKSEYIAQLCDENNSLKDTMNLNNSRLESLSVKFKNTLTQLRNSRESESRKLADATAQLHNAQEQLFLDKRNAEEKEVESLERLKLEECAVKDKHDRIILDAQQKAFEIVDEANTRLAARWKAVEEVEKISAVRNKRWEEQRKIIETTMNDELIERKRVLEMQEAEMQHERTTLEYHRNQTQIESKLTIEKAEIDASNIREVAQAALLRVQDKEAELNVSLCDVQGREDELNDKIRNFETYQALAEEEQRSKYLLLEQDINDEKNLLTNKYATMFADLEKRISEHFALVKSTEESLKTREESLLTSEAMLQSKLAESQLSIKLSEEQHSELMATETSILQKKRDSLDALEVSLNKRKMELASEAMRLKELDHELTARSVAQALEEQRSREDMKLASSTLEEERIKFEQFVTKTRLEIEEEREEVFIETERIEEEKTKNENDIATFEEEMNSRNKQISFELSKLESDKHDFELLRKSFEEASAKLESDRASFLATWNEFNNRNEALHSEILELTEREEVLETDLQELNRDRMEFEEEKRQFLAERDEIHSEKAQIERELADGKQSLEEQRQELRLAEEFHQNELQHLKSATDQLEAQQRQLGNLENQLTKKEHELLVKHDQILEEQQELQRERESLARVTVNDECNGKLKEEQAKLNELWQEFNLRNEALQQEFQSQVQLAQELEKAKDEIEVQKGELGAMQKQLTRQQQELLMEQQELQKERASLAKERVANNHEGKTEQEQAKLNEQWKEFHLRNESLQQEFQSQLQLAQELEKAKVDMEVQQRELGNLQKQLHEEQQQLLKEREQLLTKQDELQQDHSLLAEERDSLATRSIQSAEIEKDVERWKTDLQQINEEKENLELALRETRQALEDREAALKAARESLDAAKSEKQLDLESWEKELNSKAVDLMMEKNKIDSSMAAIETAAEEKELVEQKCRTLECLVEHLSGKWDRLVVKYPGMANQIDVEIASLK